MWATWARVHGVHCLNYYHKKTDTNGKVVFLELQSEYMVVS